MKYFGIFMMIGWLGIMGMPFHNATATPYDYQNPAGAGQDRVGDVYGVGGQAAGRVGRDGYLTDAHGMTVGHMDSDGFLYDLHGGRVGRISQGGYLSDDRGSIIGNVDQDGAVYGPNGVPAGRILQDGTLLDASGSFRGRVPPADRTAGMLMLLGRMPS